MKDVDQLERFPLGRIVMTKGVHLSIATDQLVVALLRHAKGDWGDVCDEDRHTNEESLTRGFRLLSEYRSLDNTKFWIISEADRSCTTILLPEEY
ncbi:hypothetical protein K239x_55010 [Planctomycetes bacterium K23_9]|uniref:Type I restriction endonuclease subunit M n=2 Tax=Stieleria marina TaxID=1930275 RepID=A0A517P293_9BACT|nr:hypothetical protein K239x_55010 [Planctomycetes bacterium K23_9]